MIKIRVTKHGGLGCISSAVLPLCQLPSMLHHENRVEPRREVLEQRGGIPAFILLLSECVHATYVALQVGIQTSQAIMSCTGDHE